MDTVNKHVSLGSDSAGGVSGCRWERLYYFAITLEACIFYEISTTRVDEQGILNKVLMNSGNSVRLKLFLNSLQPVVFVLVF